MAGLRPFIGFHCFCFHCQDFGRFLLNPHSKIRGSGLWGLFILRPHRPTPRIFSGGYNKHINWTHFYVKQRKNVVTLLLYHRLNCCRIVETESSNIQKWIGQRRIIFHSGKHVRSMTNGSGQISESTYFTFHLLKLFYLAILVSSSWSGKLQGVGSPLQSYQAS